MGNAASDPRVKQTMDTIDSAKNTTIEVMSNTWTTLQASIASFGVSDRLASLGVITEAPGALGESNLSQEATVSETTEKVETSVMRARRRALLIAVNSPAIPKSLRESCLYLMKDAIKGKMSIEILESEEETTSLRIIRLINERISALIPGDTLFVYLLAPSGSNDSFFEKGEGEGKFSAGAEGPKSICLQGSDNTEFRPGVSFPMSPSEETTVVFFFDVVSSPSELLNVTADTQMKTGATREIRSTTDWRKSTGDFAACKIAGFSLPMPLSRNTGCTLLTTAMWQTLGSTLRGDTNADIAEAIRDEYRKVKREARRGFDQILYEAQLKDDGVAASVAEEQAEAVNGYMQLPLDGDNASLLIDIEGKENDLFMG